MQVVDFIQVRKCLQKGWFWQQNSNLCHDPLILPQASWGEDVQFQGIGKTAVLAKPVVGSVLAGRGQYDREVR
jgi:hypothetical protein